MIFHMIVLIVFIANIKRIKRSLQEALQEESDTDTIAKMAAALLLRGVVQIVLNSLDLDK